MNDRNQKSQTRNLKPLKILFATEGDTEQLYLKGLFEYNNLSQPKILPKNNSPKKLLKLIKTEFDNSEYFNAWILFDKDNNNNNTKFNEIINLISKEKKIKAIWSNPNIEVWFSAYLGEITHYSKFIKIYKQKIGKEYIKTDKNIYKNLRNISADSKAIKLSERKLKETEENNTDNPAQQFPVSKMHELLNELKKIINISLD